MIIFGTKGVTTTSDRGAFFCPHCDHEQNYALKKVRRFFTLYFIPVIPISNLGEYVECDHCKGTYNTEVLNYNPHADRASLEAQFQAAAYNAVLHTLSLNPNTGSASFEPARRILQETAGCDVSPDELSRDLEQIAEGRGDLIRALQNVRDFLEVPAKEAVLKAAVRTASLNGALNEKQTAYLEQIGLNLGLSKAHTFGVVSTLGAA